MVDANPNPNPRKRGIGYMTAQELSWKLKSKADFINYLSKHRKCQLLSFLTAL